MGLFSPIKAEAYAYDVDPINQLEIEYAPVFDELTEQGQELFSDASLRHEFLEVCYEYNVKPELILSMIKTESAFNPLADNGICTGLMQIYYKWHKERMDKLNVTDLTDPIQNIKVGVDYICELKEKRNLEYALMIYNMGFAKAKEYYNEKGYSDYAVSIIEYANELAKYKR